MFVPLLPNRAVDNQYDSGGSQQRFALTLCAIYIQKISTHISNIVNDLLIQIASTIVGGILLAFIFFLVRDRFYQLPTLSGLWTFHAKTENTSYNPYKDMSLYYIVILTQEGNRLVGTGEKIKEMSSKGVREYEGKNRSRIQITGFITQRFFSADECIIHITEINELRESSTIHIMKILNSQSMNGTFISTIAAQTGSTSWTKGNSNYTFS